MTTDQRQDAQLQPGDIVEVVEARHSQLAAWNGFRGRVVDLLMDDDGDLDYVELDQLSVRPDLETFRRLSGESGVAKARECTINWPHGGLKLIERRPA